MAKQARGRPRTATAQAPPPKTALAVEKPAAEKPAAEKPAAEKPAAEKPAVALVPDAPAEQPKRGRPPATAAKPARKPKTAKKVLVLVETEEESGQFEAEQVNTVAELLDLMDEKRKVLVTRDWHEF